MSQTAETTSWVHAAESLDPRTEAFVDGAFVPAASGATFVDESPRDGRKVADVARGDGEDVDRAVRAARRAFDAGPWSEAAPRERRAVLLRLADLMEARIEDLALLESVDGESRSATPCAWTFPTPSPACGGTRRPTSSTARSPRPAGDALALVDREPLGVIGAVVPWNYPLIITAWKLAPALATGNSVVLKPAEQSPLSALLLAELAAEAGLPDGVLNVVPGFGAEAGEALGRHADVDKIAFTGSVEIGRRFLVYAGESNGKQVSLELGGKSPQVVLADAPDLDAAASAIAWSIFYNAGQTCHAGSRLVVEGSIREELVERIVAVSTGLQPGDPLDPATTVGSLIGEEPLTRILEYVDRARGDGARVACGGERAHPVPGGSYLQPTVLDGVAAESEVVREEIFGPVLAVQEAADPEDAVRLANATEYGLAASIWTRDVTTAGRIARRLRAGTVWVNTYDAGDVTTPFGGMKASGHGRDRSLHALEHYTQLKTTWISLT